MKPIYVRIIQALALVLCLVASSCQREPLQTVETGEVFLPEQDPKYRFSRNGESSVDLQEAELTLETLSILSSRYLSEAYIRTSEQLREALDLLEYGQYGYALLPRSAASPEHQETRAEITADIKELVKTSARLGGLGATNPNEHRRREAMPGRSGYIATSSSSKLSFADERGLVVMEALRGYILGAVVLDQIEGIHLSDAVTTSDALISAHEGQRLTQGTNYTELEHHWDLAYGYYLHGLRALASGNGARELRGAARRIDLAFTLGRIDLDYHLYDKLPEHSRTIRRELARVLLLRLETLLIGGNTMANLREDPRFALPMLSEGYGLLYALQFLRQESGKAYLSRAEVLELQRSLISGTGLWDTERLIGNDAEGGDLRRIMQQLRKRIQL